MKRILTVGRDPLCDIHIPDPTDIISREHAVIEIEKGGKYYLTSKGRNGTYINDVKMTSNKRIQISRTDKISFAHVQDLDWSLVPKDKSTLKSGIGIATVVLVIAAGVFGVYSVSKHSDGKVGVLNSSEDTILPVNPNPLPSGKTVVGDSVKTVETDSIKAEPVKPTPPKAAKPKKTKPDNTKGEKTPAKDGSAEQDSIVVIDAIY